MTIELEMILQIWGTEKFTNFLTCLRSAYIQYVRLLEYSALFYKLLSLLTVSKPWSGIVLRPTSCWVIKSEHRVRCTLTPQGYLNNDHPWSIRRQWKVLEWNMYKGSWETMMRCIGYDDTIQRCVGANWNTRFTTLFLPPSLTLTVTSVPWSSGACGTSPHLIAFSWIF